MLYTKFDDNSTVVEQVQDLIKKLTLSEHKNLYIQSPELLLKQINMDLYKAKIGKYLTLLYGVLDLENNDFTYSLAGHYPNPILLDNLGYTKFLFGKGFPLGILPNAVFEKFSIQIPMTGAILLFSYGIMKYLAPQEDMEYRSNYLLNMVCSSKAELSDLLNNLKLTENSNNITDDIAITIINQVK